MGAVFSRSFFLGKYAGPLDVPEKSSLRYVFFLNGASEFLCLLCHMLCNTMLQGLMLNANVEQIPETIHLERLILDRHQIGQWSGNLERKKKPSCVFFFKSKLRN